MDPAKDAVQKYLDDLESLAGLKTPQDVDAAAVCALAYRALDGNRILQAVNAVEDPMARAVTAQRMLTVLIPMLGQIRRESVLESHSSGVSYGAIGEALGLSRQRVQKLAQEAT